ncbi:hypothetical protein LTR22_027702 [Elasticomyces elasticus]|nr:hypothetical protein LTR22_027702 [Elasticomyces elasticus]
MEEINSLYQSLSRRRVFQIRIGVQTLGRQISDEKSENHVVIYLLLGGRQCVRCDMMPRDDYGEGKLTLRGHNYALSNGIIRYVDINARGCPSDFDPMQQPPSNGPSRTVQEFTNLIRGRRFRYWLVDGKGIGCRGLVISSLTAFRAAQFLEDRADIFSDGHPSFAFLISHRWDREMAPIPSPVLPALSVPSGNPQTVTAAYAAAYLTVASHTALTRLGIVLSRSDDGIEAFMQSSLTQAQNERQQRLQHLLELYTQPRHRVTANDLLSAPMIWGHLASSLRGRYETACEALRSATTIRSAPNWETHTGTLFSLLLIAILDMSGPEDEPEDDD